MKDYIFLIVMIALVIAWTLNLFSCSPEQIASFPVKLGLEANQAKMSYSTQEGLNITVDTTSNK